MARKAHIVDLEQARKAHGSTAQRNARASSGRTGKAKVTVIKGGASSRASSRNSSSSQASKRSSAASVSVRTVRSERAGGSAGARQARTVRGSSSATQQRKRNNQSASRSGKAQQASSPAALRSRGAKGRRAGASAGSGSGARSNAKRNERASKRLDRMYARSVRDDEVRDEGSSRAAVYQTKMGASHKKALRMQSMGASSQARSSVFSSALGVIEARTANPRMRLGLLVLAFVLLSAIFLYPATRDYYVAVREQARATAEYELVAQRNADLARSIASLQTEAGIEDRARGEYGWAKDGENVVTVVGLGSSESKMDVADLANAKATTPTTWYSGILDPVFGYNS